MRLFAVTDSITSMGDVDRMVRHHLDVLSVEDTVLFLSHHIGDPGLHRIKVVPDFLHLIRLVALGHDWLAGNDTG